MRTPFSFRPIRSRSTVWTLALVAGTTGGTLYTAGVRLEAAELSPQETHASVARSAEALVEEALTREIYGLTEDRDALLARAEALAPEAAAIKWHRGMILVDGKWAPAEEVAADAAASEDIAAYVAKRDSTPDTIEGHLVMAEWCKAKRLFDQERAHLARVLTFEPEHAAARARLGFVRVGAEWVGREEIARAIADDAKAQASIKKHGNSLRDLGRLMGDKNQVVRDRAAEKIRAIRDVSMIPALESLVAGVNEDASLVVLEALSGMPEKEAAVSLARFAVLSPSVMVRAEAADLLKERKLDHFVPEMMASMTAPVRTELAISRGADGRLVYRHSLYREAMRSADLLIRDTVYAGTREGGDSAARMANADFGVRASMTEAFVTLDHLRTHEFNARVGETLAKVTDQKLGADAQGWWNWWNQHNEFIVQGDKQVNVQYAAQTVLTPGTQINAIRSGNPQDSFECLAAGTLVLTNRGDVAIEQVRVGDLVLAQDVESGELTFKPVLETSIRPVDGVLRIEHEKGSFRCSGGHPFWVSGEGWVNARRLKSGMELHTLEGSVRISDVVADGAEQTYNMIVEDFSSYFVGEARVLSHDNSIRESTDAIVPGLEQK
ncbi:MAG TPA: polymorphic toxin-type HINT domain-containing protein [Pirellulaceae bacterium]|jgi:hypothetical protein|nr:polymorphic toxin-type HINT domain-containing protein [Pirellulaceae bacterium]